ncbi:MAG TPA: acyloxyacyl hydrolase [candidate division Zixibacteria bacterium]|nr:acyloxyacyl hydrolase [candidate division Zixibacteria bacterium]
MKARLAVIIACLFCVFTAWAQDDYAAPLRREHWDAAVYAGGGTGVGDATNVQYVSGGFRISRVMTGELGPGFMRGTFEYGWEVEPVSYVLISDYKNVYGVKISPLMLKWNFTGHHKKNVPFFFATGSYIHTNDAIPARNTSPHNFESGAGIGMHHFVKPGQAITFDMRAVHLSNASIGDHNPGINANIQWTLGYTWFKK